MTWILTGVTAFLLWMTFLRDRKSMEPDVKDHVPMWLWVALISFVGWTIASFFLSTTGNYGLDEVLRTTSFVLLFLWIVRRGGDVKLHGELIRALSIVTIIACTVGLFVYVFQPVNRAVGTFFDHRFHTDYWPNAWAQYLLLVWPVVLYWALKNYNINNNSVRGRVELLVRSAIFGLVVGCFLLSYSRAAIIASVIQLVLWTSVLYFHHGKRFAWEKVFPVAVLVAAVAFLVFLGGNSVRSHFYEVQDVKSKVTFTADEGSSSIGERAQFWVQAGTLMLERPVFGWGPYSFRFIQPRMQEGVLQTSDHPHNVFLKLGMERGVIPMVLFFIMLGWVMLFTAKSIYEKDKELNVFSFRAALFVAISGVILHNLVDFNLQFVGIALPFWLFVAFLAFPLIPVERKAMSKRVAYLTELVLVTALLVVAFYEGVFLTTSSFGRHAEARGDTDTAITWYERSQLEKFKRDMDLSRTKIYYENMQMEEAQGALDDYFQDNSKDYRAWKRQGDISFAVKDYQKAFNSYTQAYNYGKYNDVDIANRLIKTMITLKKREDVDNRREEFDTLLQEFALAVQRNSHFVALSPNAEGTVGLAEGLSKLYYKDAPFYQVLAARADFHSRLERERLKARPPGFLW